MSELNNSLLEELKERASCLYLSDLTSAKFFSPVSQAVKAISLDSYSDKEWINAANYIAQGKKIFAEAEKARGFLVKLH